MTIQNKKNKSFFRRLIAFSGIFAVVIVLLIILTCHSDDNKPFRYGSMSYYFNVDQVVRNFPLIGADRRNTVYKFFGGDGPSAPTITLSYFSNSNTKTVNAFYRKICNKMGYRFKPDESSAQILNFTAKKPFNELSLEIYPTKQGSKVRLIFIYELAM
jgi:hypothetical protein